LESFSVSIEEDLVVNLLNLVHAREHFAEL
jgi:hypothetical protein